MMAQRNITDRAHRYRAQKNVPDGPKVCAWCGSRRFITVDHVDGHPDHSDGDNLQYLCKSCNTAKGVEFRNAGKGRPTNQYNPASKEIPTYAQYAWAVSNGQRDQYPNSTRHAAGVHDEAGAIIHATPKYKRQEYARRIASSARARARAADDDRWNPAWGSTSSHYTRKPGGKFQDVSEHKSVAAARRASLAAAKAQERAKSKEQKKAEALRRKFETLQRKAVPASRRMSDKGILAELMRNPSKVLYVASARKKGNIFVPDVSMRGEEPDEIGRREMGAFGHPAVVQGSRVDALRSAKEIAADLNASGPGPLTKKDRYREEQGRAYEAYQRMRKKNPAEASAEVYEEFHGHPSTEVVTVTQKVHRHTHLASAGELKALVVKGVDGQVHKISGFKGALLAFNEAKNQLFVRGGDQSLNLGDFGIKRPHELETLGRVKEIDYHTDKSHLGDEGGRAVYNHRFRTTNENGEHVVVDIARYPDLIYRVLDEQFEFSGGSYLIRAEGIDV